ncbi:MAG: DUF1573 domain-containing protein [Flavobacteriaceae bacterium]
MKRIFLAFSAIAMLGFISCKENAANKINTENVAVAAERDAAAKQVPVMTFDKQVHDFGTIEQNAPQETLFTFTNTGNAPLIITDAKSSCGCTIPTWTKEPVAPGGRGELLVKFNGSGQNQVTKTITVIANTEKGQEQLRIQAFVNAPGGGPQAGPVSQ